jgi:hypothetical protein
MTAAFSGSLTAIDTDADGLQDRIYAGDLAGRIWRFDIHNGSPAQRWISGGVFADLGRTSAGGDGVSFLAPPDVSLAINAGGHAWLNIAVGTANRRNQATINRFFVLRDFAVRGQWSDEQFAAWHPLRVSDLIDVSNRVDAPQPAPPVLDIAAGYTFALGAGSVWTQPITVDGRLVIAVAEATPQPATQCRALVSLVAIDAASGRPGFDLNNDHTIDARDLRVMQAARFNTAATFTIAVAENRNDPAICRLGAEAIAACSVRLPLRRRYWRREDAD